MTGEVVAACSVYSLFSGDEEYELVIHDSFASSIRYSYGDGVPPCFTQLWTMLTLSLRQAPVCQS
jgi:hypothetical protein